MRVNQSDRETYMAGQTSLLCQGALTTCITSGTTFPKVTVEDLRVEQECLSTM